MQGPIVEVPLGVFVGRTPISLQSLIRKKRFLMQVADALHLTGFALQSLARTKYSISAAAQASCQLECPSIHRGAPFDSLHYRSATAEC
jgi:hypothetical protein